ncbi:GNAT family N-acetyltransferase [Alicyclobacillus sp. SO9]|uniref:GNAT family N-acetyltransferase n=1 Tax=Alicyclobacillus sp. SO9 TaxID=2665646 RepID=UPI0018E835AB|nr:GNAT family protein [Alicyclobacillus sp. SO9]QQE80059.1 GNAT family N-acetyltransferase [Alicyclobacillus sp. SO9]
MVKLEYFTSSDFEQLMGWITSAEFLLQWGGSAFTYPLTGEQLQNYIQHANQPGADSLVFRVVESSSSKVVGHISLGRIDRANQSARIGKVLVGDPAARGKGLGQSMTHSVLEIAFDRLKLHRVSLGVFDFNQAAIAAYEKTGFQLEGVLRHARKTGHEYWNLCEMSILAEEWKETRAAGRVLR